MSLSDISLDCQNSQPVALEDGMIVINDALSSNHPMATFNLEVARHQWLHLQVTPDADAQTSTDMVLRINTPKGTPLATVDDSLLQNSHNPDFFYRTTTDGPLCLQVFRYIDWLSDSHALSGKLPFTLTATAHDDTNVLYADETPAPLLTTGKEETWVVNGVTNQRGKVEIKNGETPMLLQLFTAMAIGQGDPQTAVSGSGSSADVVLNIYPLGDNTPAARLEMGFSRTMLILRLSPNTSHIVRFSPPSNFVEGTNDFYSMRLVVEPITDITMEPLNDNDQPETAGQFPMLADQTEILSGRVVGELERPDDVDYFVFDPAGATTVHLFCGGATTGAGIERFNVTLLDDSQQVIAQQTEQGLPIVWSTDIDSTKPPVTLTAPDKLHFLRIMGDPIDVPQSHLYTCTLLLQ